MNSENTAKLYNIGNMAIFEHKDTTIRFRVSNALVRFEKILLYDNGYIEVLANYGSIGIVEDYIDLNYILETLYMSPTDFLKDVKEVILAYD